MCPFSRASISFDVTVSLERHASLVSLTRVIVCFLSAEISAVLKVDNRIVGHTPWKPLGKEAWGQSFSIDLERVSGRRREEPCKLFI